MELEPQVDVIVIEHRQVHDRDAGARLDLVEHRREAVRVWRGQDEPEVEVMLTLVVVVQSPMRWARAVRKIPLGLSAAILATGAKVSVS